jgi:thymidylate synthase
MSEKKKEVVEYKPYEKRIPDAQYRRLLAKILREGEVDNPVQDSKSLSTFGYQMRFPLNNGIPIITERDVVNGKYSIFYQSLGELFGFLNGARTQKELESYGCRWWSSWVTERKCRKRGLEPGDLGPGSYGPAWTSFPTLEGGSFDQINHLIEQIKELPHLRTHLVNPWIPQYIGRGKGKKQKVVVVPCHGWFHVKVHLEAKELSLHHLQRSADVPVGLTANLIQYAALTMMIAQVTGYRARELVYTISDAHIYFTENNPEKDQRPQVEEMLQHTSERLPTLRMSPDINDIRSFRQEHFRVEDYYPKLKRQRIWTPI